MATGFHLGEWLEPDSPPNPDPSRDHGIVATAHLFRSATLLARAAAVLGEPDVAATIRPWLRRSAPRGDGSTWTAQAGCNGNRLGTGFLATGLLLPTLADHGYLDVAYELLLSTGAPSWLGMLDAGATTMWEWWDGVTGNGVRGSPRGPVAESPRECRRRDVPRIAPSHR